MILFLKKKHRLKNLSIMLKKTGGRNLLGKIATFHKGCGYKRRYKLIAINKFNIEFAIIRDFIYDPLRNAFLALLCYRNGFLSYYIATVEMSIGDILMFNINNDHIINLNKKKINLKTYTSLICNYEIGTFVNNFEFNLNNNNYCTRAAGTKSIILKKYKNNVLVKLPSKQLRLILNFSKVVKGQVSNLNFKFKKLIKASDSRHLGLKSKVRGVAKNPIDHPHGGGEGKTSGGRCSVSPWGILTKGFPTVRGKKRKLRLISKLL